MKKLSIGTFLLSTLCLTLITGCGNGQSSSQISSGDSSSISSETSSSDTSSDSSHTFSDPVFSQSSYSYDKNVGRDLEMPVELNGVDIYSVNFDNYKLSSKQYEYNETHKTLNIKESFMANVIKGTYNLYVVFDEEVNPASIEIVVMNSVITSFDTSTKTYEFGRTGDLVYDCDFSSASIKELRKGDVVIPSSYYSYNNKKFTLSEELLNRLCGDAIFDLYLTNNDNYQFTVSTDIMFFSDYDITTIHSDIESIYGANPLYQYASSDHISIVEAGEFGMNGKALKYVPNNVEVELDCHAIMTLADTLTGMSWYKVGYTRSGTYLISFDYETIGSSDVSGQTFQFATVTTWGAPFTYSQNLLLGPSNDGVVHHFSVVLTGEQIQSGTFIYAKWLGGSGYLLLDNMRVTEIKYPFVVSDLTSYRNGDGDYQINLSANGWKYEVLVDDNPVSSAQCSDTKVIIPSSFMDTLSVGEHKVTFVTPAGNYDKTFSVISSGTSSFNELSKSYSDASSNLKLSGAFNNVALTKAIKYGQMSCDSSHTEGLQLNVDDFEVVSDGFIVKPNVLRNIYNTASIKLTFSNADSHTITLQNSKQIFVSNFNESDVWYHEFDGTATNCFICQDTSMISFATKDGRKHLVYEPKKATLGHSKTPGTYQNGFYSFRRNDSTTSNVFWEPLNYVTSKTYRITLKYDVEGSNANTKLIFYRWLGGGTDDRTMVIDPSLSSWTYEFSGSSLSGFYFYCSYTASSDVLNYKVNVYSLSVEEI